MKLSEVRKPTLTKWYGELTVICDALRNPNVHNTEFEGRIWSHANEVRIAIDAELKFRAAMDRLRKGE